MSDVFLALLLISLLCLVVGLVNPGMVIRWGTTRTRGRATMIYGSLTVILFVLFGVSAPRSTESDRQPDEDRPSTDTAERQTKRVGNRDEQGAEQAVHFSALEITDVTIREKDIAVTGTTDLPDGANVHVIFHLSNPPRSSVPAGTARAACEAGSFSATLPMPEHPAFAVGPYEVRVLFTPRGQNNEVLAQTGEDGEQLSGPLAEGSRALRTLQTSKVVSLQLDVKPFPMVRPEDHDAHSPERAVARFLLAWKERDWKGMIDVSQITWRARSRDPVAEVRDSFGIMELLGAEVIGSKRASAAMVDVTVKVHYAFGIDVRHRTISARVIRELGPYKPSAEGQWGVNPISATAERYSPR